MRLKLEVNHEEEEPWIFVKIHFEHQKNFKKFRFRREIESNIFLEKPNVKSSAESLIEISQGFKGIEIWEKPKPLFLKEELRILWEWSDQGGENWIIAGIEVRFLWWLMPLKKKFAPKTI